MKYLRALLLLTYLLFSAASHAASPPTGSYQFTITDVNSGIDYPAYIALLEFGGSYWIEARYLNGDNATSYTFIAGPNIPQGDQYYETQQDVIDIVDGALLVINGEIADIFGVQPTGGDLGWLNKVKLYIMSSLVESDNVIRSK